MVASIRPARELAELLASPACAGIAVQPLVDGACMVHVGGEQLHAANLGQAVVLIADSKRLATLQARAALLGVQLVAHEGDHGPELVATRGAATWRFPELADLAGWLAELEGSA